MKISLFTVIAAVGLTTLAACGGSDNGAPVSSNSGGSSSSGSSGSGSTSSGPNSNSSAPTDFVAYVNEQFLSGNAPPAFGTAPAATTGLTTDLALGNNQAFIVYQFGAGSVLPANTYSAFAACTTVGVMACNPAVSADLNSTEN